MGMVYTAMHPAAEKRPDLVIHTMGWVWRGGCMAVGVGVGVGKMAVVGGGVREEIDEHKK